MLEHVLPLYGAFYELLERVHLHRERAIRSSQQPAAIVTIKDIKIRMLTSNIKF